MLLDLWDNEALTKNFMELYDLTGIQMCNILKRMYFDANPDSVSVFCEETGIPLDAVDVANDIAFIGKLVSTTTDNFEHLKQVGLVPVDILLESDSPISRHLREYGIVIKPSRHAFIYNGEQYCIPSNGTDCRSCAYGDEKCRYDDKKYKDMYCSYLEAISPLATKLYSDRAEIELFLLAPKEKMLGYSTVKRYPEIFDTIETLMKDFFQEELSIGKEWAQKKQTSYIVTLSVQYENMSYRNGYISGADGGDALYTYWDYEEFCQNAYDDTDQIPKCFWDNIWLIRTCLNAICSIGQISTQICAGIHHDVRFPYDGLTIELV